MFHPARQYIRRHTIADFAQLWNGMERAYPEKLPDCAFIEQVRGLRGLRLLPSLRVHGHRVCRLSTSTRGARAA